MERKIVELNTKELIEQLKLIGEVNRICIFDEKCDVKINKANAELSYTNAGRILIIQEELEKRLSRLKQWETK